ncbi:hypothetical protein IWW36_001676 [Coemansia brasiliensis]|uniref:Uncharacterized protein n=1 Tax=Coemansia brasiliensis TaxID=2650707 RepID=A0A9W8IB65_9FUNG|nr:hypothetical protein IWW36_001676 [Coemansia brasiliensis]
MADLDLDSKTILDGLAHLDKHDHLPPNVADALSGIRFANNNNNSSNSNNGKEAGNGHAAKELTFGTGGPNAIATLKVETGAVLKELARFRACDDQTMSCFYCREWAQWVYRKQISLQGATNTIPAPNSANAVSRKKKNRGQQSAAQQQQQQQQQQQAAADDAERDRMERRRMARSQFTTVKSLCACLHALVDEERQQQQCESSEQQQQQQQHGEEASDATGSRPESPVSAGGPRAKDAAGERSNNGSLIEHIVDRVTLWFEGYQFPLADVYEDLTFDFPADAFPYDDNQDPLDPALLLPALHVTKGFISLPAPSFPLLGNITSELIATHTYPTCQHTKADHPTPSELETQRLIFNSQLQKWRAEYKRSFEREMEPVWQITQLLLKSAQRIETMRVRLFARGCRANREQFLQTIRSRAQPFAEYWARVSEAFCTDGEGEPGKRRHGKRGAKAEDQERLTQELDTLVFTHLDNLLEVSASWSRTFLESYYGVAREFARELETILGECITMCDRRAQGLKYPPPLSLEPQLTRARSAISCLQPQLESRIERIQRVVRERNSEIFSMTEDLRKLWTETSGSTVQSKLAKAGHKDFKKRMRRIEYQQQNNVIGWAMRELEHLLTAADVAQVVTDCLELLMTEAEILERAVGQVFVRKLELTTEDLREQRQDIIDDFTEGLLTGREELAGIVGKLMLKEAWRILESNISLQRQKLLLDTGGSGSRGHHAAGGQASGSHASSKGKKKTVQQNPAPATGAAEEEEEGGQEEPLSGMNETDNLPALAAAIADEGEGGSGKKRKKNKKSRKKKGKKGSAATNKQSTPAPATPTTVHEDEEEEEEEETHNDEDTVGDPQNPFATLNWADKQQQQQQGGTSSEPRVSGPTKGSEAPEASTAAAAAGAAVATSEEPAAPTGGSSNETRPAESSNSGEEPGEKGRDEAGRTRPRRGTNAARYVPGVGFVSEDGMSATSPQLLTSSGTFKGAGGLRNAMASGRMSPMNAAARLAASRPHSPLVSGRPGSAQSGAAILDREQLQSLQTGLLTGPIEAMERVISGLSHENAVALAQLAMSERRRLQEDVTGWHASVSSVLHAYDAISTQLGAFKQLCETRDAEVARLSSMLAQATRDAQLWRDRFDQLAAQVQRGMKPSEKSEAWGSNAFSSSVSSSLAPQQQQLVSTGQFSFAGGSQQSTGFVAFGSAPMLMSQPGMSSVLESHDPPTSHSLLTALNTGTSQPY